MIILDVDYWDLKKFCSDRAVIPQILKIGQKYNIIGINEEIALKSVVPIEEPRSQELNDIETNLLLTASVPAKKIDFKNLMSDSVSPNSSKTTSYTFDEDKIITGIVFKVNSYTPGDKITINVKDPLNNIVSTFVKDWFIDNSLYETPVPKTLIFAGIKIELTYTNVAALLGNTAKWYMNAKLWNK